MDRKIDIPKLLAVIPFEYWEEGKQVVNNLQDHNLTREKGHKLSFLQNIVVAYAVGVCDGEEQAFSRINYLEKQIVELQAKHEQSTQDVKQEVEEYE